MRRLSEGKIATNIIYMTLPILITHILQNVYNLTDMFFVGRLGPASIASVSMSGVIVGIVITFAVGLSTGTLSLVSRSIGARKKRDAEKAIGQSLLISFLVYLIVFIFAVFFLEPTFKFMGAEEEVASLGIRYARIVLIGSIFIFLSVVMNSSLRASGDSITPAKIMFLSIVMNIILDPILIYGLLGFPRLGVEGAAIATVVSRIFAVLIVSFILFSGRHHLRLGITDLLPDFRVMFKIFKIGIFASISMLMRNISSLILMKIIAVFGTLAIAAYGIGLRILMFLFSMSFSIGKGTAAVVGQSFGAGKKKRARDSVHISIKMFSGFIILASLLVMIFSKWIVGIFTNDANVISIGQQYLLYTMPVMIFAVISVISSYALAALGKTFEPMLVTFVALFLLQIPLAFVLRDILGLVGVWIAMDFAQIFQCIFNFLLFEKFANGSGEI